MSSLLPDHIPLPKEPECDPPLHSLGIDGSWSMLTKDLLPSRLHAAIDAAVAYVERLKVIDSSAYVGVACYSDSVFALFEPAPVLACAAPDALRREWYRLATERGGGRTNIGGALELAAVWSEAGHGDAQVVLLTDGHSNVGPDPVEAARSLRDVASITAVGIGESPSDIDEALLKEIVSADRNGRPRYRWIGERDALVAHYQELAGHLTRE